jgi:hypothetical protein
MDISPFTHVAKLPGGALAGAPIGWLMLVSVLLAAVGLTGFRRRDIGSQLSSCPLRIASTSAVRPEVPHASIGPAVYLLSLILAT